MATTENGLSYSESPDHALSPLLTATQHRDGLHGDMMTSYPSAILDMSGFSPDLNMVKAENSSLRTKLRQIQDEFQREQDMVFVLRKKLNGIEKDRLEAVAKANGEASRLDSEVTKLRAQLERGEAVRQNLEFELAKSRKGNSFEKKSMADRENLITEVNENMKQKLSELTSQMEVLCTELERSKHQGQEDTTRLRDIITDKEKIISEYRMEKDSHDTERDHLDAAIAQKDKVMANLEDNIHQMEARERQLVDTNRQQLSEMELIREKEERLRRDYETVQERTRALEESIEAERAAHLESKFNSEIVQLRIRDLENALDLEKTAKAEALSSTDNMTKQIRELQHVYEDERRSGQHTRDKLEKHWQPILRAEKEYASLNKQLHHELEDKRLVIQKLSGQLDVHQKNFDELKQELNKAKKRQIYLEEAYSGTTKELEILLDNFCLIPPGKHGSDKTTSKKKTPAKKKDGSKSPSLAVLLEGMRHLLMDYRRKVDDLNSDMTRIRTQNEHMVKECQQFKDVMWAKDKALESTQQGMSETSKELRKVQIEMRDTDGVFKQLREQSDATQRELDKQKHHSKTVSEQMNKMSTKWKAGEQVSLEFLQALFKQLNNMHRGGATDQSQLATSTCWTDLALYVNDQVAVLLTELRRSEEKVHQLETRITNKDQQITQLQKTHAEQLEKLAQLAEGRTKEWQQQKAEMEKHYTQLLAEIHSRQKKTQALADQAWEKVRVTGSVQQGLESECTNLRVQVTQYLKEHDTLLAACALLSGALYPLYIRYSALSTQRQLLIEQLNNFIAFKREVQMLVEALSGESSALHQGKSARGKGPGLLRFRKSVLAVIMANRLVNVTRGNCKMFSTTDALPGVYNMLVCSGYVEPISKTFTGVSNPWVMENDKIVNHGQEAALSWLSSGDLLSTITTTMSDLQTALQKAKQGDSSMDSSQLVAISRSCFQKYVCHLPFMFSTLQSSDVTPSSRDRGLLVRRLGHGLSRSLDQFSSDVTPVSSSQAIVSSLQQYMLQFTQRLHDAEVERRDLRVEMTALRQTHENLSSKATTAEGIEHEVITLRQQVEDTVARDRFEHACEELNKALRREQQAQQLLTEQSQQIHQLGITLDVQRTEDNEKEYTLAQAVKGLTEAKMELKRQDQRFRQQNKQVTLLDEEKKTLVNNIRDAETALKTASRDRDTITMYIHSVEEALECIKSQLAVSSSLSSKVDFMRLISADLLPAQLGKPGPDFTACQNLVSVFVDCQKQLNGRIVALQDEVRSHKEHINALKGELSAACRREYDDEVEKFRLDGCHMLDEPVKLANMMSGDDTSPAVLNMIATPNEDEFVLLVGESSDSIHAQTIPAIHKAPTKRSKTTTASTKYHTPQVSHRYSTGRRKPDIK